MPIGFPGYDTLASGNLHPVVLEHRRTSHFLPMANATMVEVFLVKKYLPPGLQVVAHASRSY
jgi:hypothetical protein